MNANNANARKKYMLFACLSLLLVLFAAGCAQQAPPSSSTSAVSGAQASAVATTAPATPDDAQVIHISVYGYGYDPPIAYAKPNTKTKLIFDAKELTGCNQQIQIPSLGVFSDLKKGENVIEFTTGPSGSVIDYACGMNMLKGKIVVS